MRARRRKSYREVMHDALGIRFLVVGARVTESGNCFCVIDETNPGRERLFLADCFTTDISFVERDALFETLRAKEVSRVKAKNRKEVLEARARNARSRAASDAEDEQEQEYENSQRDLSEESSAEYEPDEPQRDFEIIAPADSFGLEQLPEAEADEIEVLED